MRKNRHLSLELENALVDAMSSLRYYEPEYRSVLRFPGAEKERIHTFEQYIECRLNFELSCLPDISSIARDFEGFLISVTEVEGKNEKTRRFSKVVAEINTSCLEYSGEDLEGDLKRVHDFLGGSRITIIHSKRKPTIIID